MGALRRSDVDALLEVHGEGCVSIFIPTVRPGNEVQQNPKRFKHMLDDAERRLIETGVRTAAARGLLQPARDLLADSHFWNQQKDGLAVFLGPAGEGAAVTSASPPLVYRLPVAVPELAVVGERFHVRPLLPAIWPDVTYHILALSLRGARLLRARRFEVERLELKNVPAGIDDIVRFVDAEKQRQVHTGERRGPRASGVFHGHGEGRADEEERVWEYARSVARGVHERLLADGYGERSVRAMRGAPAGDGRGHWAPLVLAGVEHLRGLYREAHATVAGGAVALLEQGIDGSPDRLTDGELHERAWPLVAPLADLQVGEALTRWAEADGRNDVPRDVHGILVAGLQGRVETLFVAHECMQWGRFDETTARISLHDARRGGDEELLGRAAALTVRGGGIVYTLPEQDMPRHRHLAALPRY
jgi:hypothetical protein